MEVPEALVLEYRARPLAGPSAVVESPLTTAPSSRHGSAPLGTPRGGASFAPLRPLTGASSVRGSRPASSARQAVAPAADVSATRWASVRLVLREALALHDDFEAPRDARLTFDEWHHIVRDALGVARDAASTAELRLLFSKHAEGGILPLDKFLDDVYSDVEAINKKQPSTPVVFLLSEKVARRRPSQHATLDWKAAQAARQARQFAAAVELEKAHTAYKIVSRLRATNFDSAARGAGLKWEPVAARFKVDGTGLLDARGLEDVIRRRLRMPKADISDAEIAWIADCLDMDGSGALDVDQLADLIEHGVVPIDEDVPRGAEEYRFPEVQAPGRDPIPLDPTWAHPVQTLDRVPRALKLKTAHHLDGSTAAAAAAAATRKKKKKKEKKKKKNTFSTWRDYVPRAFFQRWETRSRDSFSERRKQRDLLDDIDAVEEIRPIKIQHGALDLFPQKPRANNNKKREPRTATTTTTATTPRAPAPASDSEAPSPMPAPAAPPPTVILESAPPATAEDFRTEDFRTLIPSPRDEARMPSPVTAL